MLCYLTNINKCLTVVALFRLNHNVVREWLLNILDFAKSQLLVKSLLPPTLLKPLFAFLEGFERALATAKHLIDLVRQVIAEFVLEYTSCLLRVSDARATHRQPNTDILPMLLAMEPDPLEHPNLI